MSKSVAIVGYGYLGAAYQNVFPEAIIYDEPKEIFAGESTQELGRLAVNNCDFAIISVPTDYNDEGELDVSIVEDIVSWCDSETILIKSALQPGTVDRLVKETGKNIAVSVEFIGEGKYWQPPAITEKDRLLTVPTVKIKPADPKKIARIKDLLRRKDYASLKKQNQDDTTRS